MILGFGLLARGMQTGKYRSWAAIVLALAAVCHGIVLIYTAIGALVIVLINSDTGKRLRYGLTVGLGTLLLSAFWVGPFLLNHEYMTDMKYGGRPEGAEDSFYDMFFPLTAPLDILITTLAIIGFVACIARRHLNGTALGIIGLLTLAGVYATRESLPIIGLLWNPRLLPFLYFVRYLLMMVGIVEVAGLLANLWRDGSPRGPSVGSVVRRQPARSASRCSSCSGSCTRCCPATARRPRTARPSTPGDRSARRRDGADAQGDGWSRYNFMGYEGRTHYPEYHDVVQTMADIGRTNGCGRATWENNEDNGQYGTTMALMLLPHWTDGCIASMEGLFFEASGTTPYHFLTTAAMSKKSSNPVRELRYVDNDAAVGVRHLQDLGVRYTMVRTDEAKREAAAQPELELAGHQRAVGDLPGRRLGHRRAARRPAGRRRAGATATSASATSSSARAGSSTRTSGRRCRPTTVRRRGSASTSRSTRAAPCPTPAGRLTSRTPGASRSTSWCRSSPSMPVALPEVDGQRRRDGRAGRSRSGSTRSAYRSSSRSATSRTGRSRGPRARTASRPNLMVVVPTEHDVRLHYGRTTSDYFFYALTLVGIGMLIFLRRRATSASTTRRPAGCARPPTSTTGVRLDDRPPPRWSDDGVPRRRRPPAASRPRRS